ncbi:MAG: two pore domain potassium channel family protein [Rhodothermales bacterium]|nr:two pore domain potassium channel family protein [Rhodothermales bacterium]
MKRFLNHLENHLLIIAAFSIIIASLPFYLDKVKGFDRFTIYFMVISFVIYKSLYFPLIMVENISKSNKTDRDVFKKSITSIIPFGYMMLSFCLDYGVIEYIFNGSFSGFSGNDLASKSFDFAYYSVMTMTTLGYEGIRPESYLAKFVSMIQVLSSFLIITFILSNSEKIGVPK